MGAIVGSVIGVILLGEQLGSGSVIVIILLLAINMFLAFVAWMVYDVTIARYDVNHG
jgi:hypothetical protein